ncbi:HAMP domain-containing protein [Myxococcota bacterium]|nr:HAMP domain-containing protein [Myxococcota bacterium]
MQIRKLLMIFLSLGLALAVAGMVIAILLERSLIAVEDAQHKRHDSYLLADEMRQSADDLSRLARTYAVTREPAFRDYFSAAVAIRDGEWPRPEGYEDIYWDLVIGGKLPPPNPEGAPTPTLEGRMLDADFTVEEFNKLKESERHTDELVNLEKVAVHAMDGRFDDGSGSFEKRGEPDPELATRLLHGERYHALKAEIMLLTHQFAEMADARTTLTLDATNRRAYGLLVGSLLISATLIGCLALMAWSVQRRVIRRTATLVDTAQQISSGNLDVRSGLEGNDELGRLSQSFDEMVERLSQALDHAHERTRESERQREDLAAERDRSEKLLHNILPAVIAGRLKEGEATIAETYPEVSVLFGDIVGFTQLSDRLGPRQIVAMLNEIFGRFDGLAQQHELEKIKTIGDCYMVVAGVPERSPTHCQQIANFALDAVDGFREFAKDFGEPLQLRIGIHTGTVVAGVVGTQKFSFDLWGDVVNVASRLESTSEANRIHVSDAVQVRLADDFRFEDRGRVDLKGKEAMHTWFLEGRRFDT